MSDRFTLYIGFGYLSYGCRAPALSPKGRPLRTVCHFVWCRLRFDIPKKMQVNYNKTLWMTYTGGVRLWSK